MTSTPTRRFPRWSLAVLSVGHAALFVWAAVVLPWRSWTAFSLLTAILAALHLAVAVLAVARHRALASVWRAAAAASLAYLVYIAWGLLSSAWYIRATYAGLGQSLAAVLVAVLGLVAMVTLPFALWGIGATGGVRGTRFLGGALLISCALAAARLLVLGRAAAGEAIVREADAAEAETAVRNTVDVSTLPAHANNKRISLMTGAPASCAEAPSNGSLSLIATFVSRESWRPESRCVQSASPAELAARVGEILEDEAGRGPVKLDLVIRRFELPDHSPLIESLVFRPGLDGVCNEEGRCLMPWQLVALGAFDAHIPIPAVPDVKLGVSLEHLSRLLGDARLFRIETRSWIATLSGFQPMGRAPNAGIEIGADSLSSASKSAARYIRSAQDKSGLFKYIVHPFSGRIEQGDFSIARQSGTTLATCELAESWADRTVLRSLELLSKHEERFSIGGEPAGVLRFKPHGSIERIGPTALALAALVHCRPRVGDRFDGLIARLANTILRVQRPDGSFAHYIDTANGEPAIRTGSIFVDGQAVHALAALETLAEPEPGVFPARARLHDAVERAMTFFGERYWNIFLGDMLFMEENWHCIAAAGALGHHRHEAYEQFCLDYVAMKGRILHDEDSGVHPDFIGGYGFGNVVPPHNTSTAGHGEALAAAIKIKRARGMDVTADAERLRKVLAFLLANQWTETSCFACAPGLQIVGGFSEHMASPRIRIDYVQHAWAAIGHGAEALEME